MYLSKKQQNKPVKQIIEELMVQLFELQNRKDGISTSCKHGSSLPSYKKSNYQHYLEQSLSRGSSQLKLDVSKANIAQPINIQFQGKAKHNNSLLELIPQSTYKKTDPITNLRGLSLSNHVTQSKKLKLPRIKQVVLPQVKQDLEQISGYNLISEEHTLEIEEYMQLQKKYTKLPQL